MGSTPEFSNTDGLDAGVLASNTIIIAKRSAMALSVQSLGVREGMVGEKKLKLNITNALIQNDAKADMLTINAKAVISKEITAKPTTNAIGSRALTFVQRQVCKTKSPVFVKTTQTTIQNKMSSMDSFTLPNDIIVRINALLTKEKATASNFRRGLICISRYLR